MLHMYVFYPESILVVVIKTKIERSYKPLTTNILNLRFVTSQDGLWVGFRRSLNPLTSYIKFVVYRHECYTDTGWVVVTRNLG